MILFLSLSKLIRVEDNLNRKNDLKSAVLKMDWSTKHTHFLQCSH